MTIRKVPPVTLMTSCFFNDFPRNGYIFFCTFFYQILEGYGPSRGTHRAATALRLPFDRTLHSPIPARKNPMHDGRKWARLIGSSSHSRPATFLCPSAFGFLNSLTSRVERLAAVWDPESKLRRRSEKAFLRQPCACCGQSPSGKQSNLYAVTARPSKG